MSTEQFVTAWKRTGVSEGGYVNDPNDSGGETNWGITVAVARAHGFTGDMHNLTQDEATAIAKQSYWDTLSLDAIAARSPSIADELFDTGFLSGIGVAGLMMQRALNLFRRADLPAADQYYPELTEDGHPGKMTVYAFGVYMDKRGSQGEVVLLRCLNAQQGNYFMEICRQNPKDDKFVFGWYLNRVQI